MKNVIDYQTNNDKIKFEGKASSNVGKNLFKLLSQNQIETAADYQNYEDTKHFATIFYPNAMKQKLVFDAVAVVTCRISKNDIYATDSYITIYDASEKEFF